MPRLNNPAPPRLADPPPAYTANVFMSAYNQLRLYFQQVSNALTALFGPFGARFLSLPAGKFLSTTTQTAASTTVAYPVEFSTSVLAAGVHISGSPATIITVDHPGYYAVFTELHFRNSDSVAHEVSVWITLNGTVVANSTTYSSVVQSHGGIDGHTLNSRTHYLELVEGDELQVYWATNSLNVALYYTAAVSSPTRPAAPSAIVFVQFVSSDQDA